MSAAQRFDVIVIGTGAGGAAAAYRLALAGCSVLVLEKGAALPRDGSTLDIGRVVHEGAFLSREPWCDGRGRRVIPEEHFNVGGKTRWYGAAVVRFAPQEFAPDAAFGCSGWPIGYRDLEPYYGEAERLLDVRQFEAEPALTSIVNSLAVRRTGWRGEPIPLALSASIQSDRHEAAHFDGFASVAGLKADSDSAFLARVADRANLRIETNAEVVRLLGSGGRFPQVTGVMLADGRQYQANAILLAAGALHSPRLLQRFVAEHALTATLPAAGAIGRRLKLHLLTALVAVSPGKKCDLLRKTLLLTHAKYPHSSVQPLGFDGELIGTLVPRMVPRWLAALIGARAYGFFLQTEDGSAPDNRVFDRPGTPGGERVMDYDERRIPASAHEHRRFVRGFQAALLRVGMPSFPRRIGLAGTAHACGTLAAGTDPTVSVVDDRGRVHGVQSLYVVDGSVLPRSSRVNPSLTIFAWGLRVADLLAQGMGASRDAAPVALRLAERRETAE
jgi:choline dehydrogenase-like flavoprotein